MLNTIVQVLPTENYTVYLYFSNGEVRLYDAKEVVGKGIFSALNEKKVFMEKCTVLNHTLAWDLNGNFDPKECLDLDPEELFKKSRQVEDPLQKYA